MTAMDSRVRLELTVPGDAGHVAYRVGEAINSLVALGFRVTGRIDGGRVYLLTDHEEPVDSSTVDGSPENDAAEFMAGVDRHLRPPGWVDETTGLVSGGLVTDDDGPRPVLVKDLCGMAVCGHDKTDHVEGQTRAVAGRMAARPRGTHCRAEIAPGITCNCPGFTPVTGTIEPNPERR